MKKLGLIVSVCCIVAIVHIIPAFADWYKEYEITSGSMSLKMGSLLSMKFPCPAAGIESKPLHFDSGGEYYFYYVPLFSLGTFSWNEKTKTLKVTIDSTSAASDLETIITNIYGGEGLGGMYITDVYGVIVTKSSFIATVKGTSIKGKATMSGSVSFSYLPTQTFSVTYTFSGVLSDESSW